MDKNTANIIDRIIRAKGGIREKNIMSKPHTCERTETWNAAHKVVCIISADAEPDGHRAAFDVDIVTREIVG